VIAVKRIFKGLSEGSIVLPPAEGGGDEMMIDVEGEQIPQLDPSQAPDPTSSDPTDSSSLAVRFASLPLSSISRFLTLYPNPLTEAQLAPLTLTLPDFLLALSQIQPSSLREGFTTVPTVGFSDIGALHSTREELHMCIVEPIRRPELFEKLGVKAPCGVLMWGPPGCGKTLMAKAVAKESGANFIAVKGPELLNKVSSAQRFCKDRADAEVV
jgi:ribosome biogenesis ATPase